MIFGRRRFFLPPLAALCASATLLSAAACGDDDDADPGASAGTGGSTPTMGTGGSAPAMGAGGAGGGAAGVGGSAGQGAGGGGDGLTTRPVAAEVTSTADNVTRPALATLSYPSGAQGPRPVIVFLPGWGGVGDVPASVGAQAQAAAKAGYVTVSVGFHQVPTEPAWVSDLAESAAAALDAVCADASLPANCAAVALVGESYGGTQTHPVTRYLRAVGYGGEGREVVAFLSQDAGYTLHYEAPENAQLDLYSVAMIENMGDTTFPINSCEYGNCGAANRVAFHLAEGEAAAAHLLAMCPAGGEHGVRSTYPDWDKWTLDALKTMLHQHRGAPTFAGYEPPTLALGPNGIGDQGRCSP